MAGWKTSVGTIAKRAWWVEWSGVELRGWWVEWMVGGGTPLLLNGSTFPFLVKEQKKADAMAL